MSPARARRGREFVLVLRLDRRVGVALLAAVLVATAGRLLAETVSLVTSYPSPMGAYVRLLATGAGGLDSIFARDAGNVVVAPATNAAGKLGVGTNAPAAKLHVVGSVRIVDGTQAAGKVLTSDAAGTATWGYATYAP